MESTITLLSTLQLEWFEVGLLFFLAIIIGFTIHFTIASRRNFKLGKEKESENKLKDEWKLRYFNDMEVKDKELASLKEQLTDAEENANIYSIEAEEMRKENKKLLAEVEEASNIYVIEAEELRKENKRLLAEAGQGPAVSSVELEELRKENKRLSAEVNHGSTISSGEIEELRKENKRLAVELHAAQKVATTQIRQTDKSDYLDQLRMAQISLLEHNEKINQLLENIDIVKEKEEKQREMMKKNEELSSQIAELQVKLTDKDKEIINIRQKEHLTKEMTSMLDNAYSEFHVLQGKMQKLEAQVNSSKLVSLEYEDLKEGYRKISRDSEEQKIKLNNIIAESQQLQSQLTETEEKLRESNFQRQQLQKRVSYLEELNNDLQSVSDANKKLEGQLKRIGELESMLNMATEEKDQLIRRRIEK